MKRNVFSFAVLQSKHSSTITAPAKPHHKTSATIPSATITAPPKTQHQTSATIISATITNTNDTPVTVTSAMTND